MHSLKGSHVAGAAMAEKLAGVELQTRMPLLAYVRRMRASVPSLLSPVTAPVTRKVQGPMMLTWHRPPPAPASAPCSPAHAEKSHLPLLQAAAIEQERVFYADMSLQHRWLPLQTGRERLIWLALVGSEGQGCPGWAHAEALSQSCQQFASYAGAPRTRVDVARAEHLQDGLLGVHQDSALARALHHLKHGMQRSAV